MTLEEFLDQWQSSDDDQRFSNFLSWVNRELQGVLDLIPPVNIQRVPTGSPVAGTVSDGFDVLADLFTDDDAEFAVAVGDVIIHHYFQHAMAEWYDNQEKIQKMEKERKKYMNKLWEKLLKGVKIKGDPGYAQWYYSYYLPKYYGHYGSA